MKHVTILFVSMLLVSSVALSEPDDVLRTVTVSGNAETKVVPDQVVVYLGVETFNEELKAAKEENDRVMTAVLSSAKRNGVTEEQLKSDYLNLQPQYSKTHKERMLLGYLVTRRIEITITNIDKFEVVLTDALEAGANRVDGIDFQSTEPRQHKDEARSLAVTAAKEKAEAMANQLGQKIGRPVKIVEDAVHRRPAPTQFNVTRAYGESGGGFGGPTVPGRITVSARVTVTFELVE